MFKTKQTQKYLLYLLSFAWFIFLFIQRGDPADEGEHCHVAWLISRIKLTPLNDFFQHHQPLLWQLLRLYFDFNGHGPEVVYFGRSLVVLASLISLLCIIGISRNLYSDKSVIGLPIISICIFSLACVAFPRLLVIRPESLSLCFYLLSIYLWTKQLTAKNIRLFFDITSGIFFGLACFSSPRFLILAPTYLIISSNFPLATLKCEFKRFLIHAIGFILIIVIYFYCFSFPLTHLLFNISFSSTLQYIGQGGSILHSRIYSCFGILFASLIAISCLIPAKLKKSYKASIMLLVLICVCSYVTAGNHLYSQNLMTPLTWALFIGISYEAGVIQNIAERLPKLKNKIMYFYSTIIVIFLALIIRDIYLTFYYQNDLFRITKRRVSILALTSPQDKVMIQSAFHPITTADASYYVCPLVDSNDRLCRAVKLSDNSFFHLPTCNYLLDLISASPAIVDAAYLKIAREADRTDFARFLFMQYHPSSLNSILYKSKFPFTLVKLIETYPNFWRENIIASPRYPQFYIKTDR